MNKDISGVFYTPKEVSFVMLLTIFIPGSLQIPFETVDFFRILLQNGFLRHFLVHLRFVLDVFGPVGVLQGAHGLLEVLVTRRHGGDDGRLRSTAERLLQDPRQFRLSVKEITLKLGLPTYMTFTLCETIAIAVI